MPNATDKKPRFHLHSMAIHTLGLVDRGANNKRWLVAKRGEEQAPEPQPIDQPQPAPADGFTFGDASVVEQITTFEPAAKSAPPPPPASEPSPEEVEKGKRLKAEQLARMWAAVSTMHELIKDLVAEVTAPPAVKPEPAPAPAAPGLDPVAFADLQKRAHEQDLELARLRAQRGTSNSMPVDGGLAETQPQPFHWPDDMNDLRKRRSNGSDR